MKTLQTRPSLPGPETGVHCPVLANGPMWTNQREGATIVLRSNGKRHQSEPVPTSAP
jgi:hypothetical protein